MALQRWGRRIGTRWEHRIGTQWGGYVADPIAELLARLGGTGTWVDPLNGQTVFSDTAGTTQAVQGGLVARIDSPAGAPVQASFTNATASQRPLLRADGLEFDGVDDLLSYPDDPALRFGLTDFTLAFAFRADAAARRRVILDKVGLSLGPELAQEFGAFVNLAGGGGSTVDNGDGTFTITGDTVSRASIPLSFLTNGATYRIELEILSTTHPTLTSNWCDQVNQTLTGITGTYNYTASRSAYDNVYRFLDVETTGAGSTTFRLVSFREVASADGWGVRQQDANLKLSFLPAGSAPTEIVVAPGVIQAGAWVRGLISFDRSANTATARINGAEQSPAAIPAGDISGSAALSLGFADGGGGRLDGTIGRFLVIDRLLSEQDKATVESWLQGGFA